jgi:pimeloyl-ACP methyl ester carboxylesterase
MEFAQIDVLDQLAKVSTPTLVIHTRGDLVNRFEDGRDLATLISGAHFIPLESRNHILLEDEPAWRDFLVQTRRFLGVKETGPETSSKEKELGVRSWLRGPKK